MKSTKPKKSRDPEKTRAHILEVAFREIHQNGFQGTSVDRIVEKTRMTKGAFFHYFATKSELGYAIVDELLREMILARWIRPLGRHENPLHGILKTFKNLLDGWPDQQLARGCPLNNLTQEMSSVDPVFRAKLQRVMRLWIAETKAALQKAKRQGLLKRGTKLLPLAEFIVMAQEGAFAMAKTLDDRKVALSIYRSLKDYLLSKTAV